MSHPEIPPCKMFFEVKGDPHGRDGLWFSVFDFHRDDISSWSHDSDFPLRIDDKLSPNEKCLIASIAYVSWASEEKRQQGIYFNACADSVLLAAIKAERHAKRNKEAWAVWGGLPL